MVYVDTPMPETGSREVDNRLERMTQYAWRQAHLMVDPASDRDDAVQEARIAVWRVMQGADRSDAYLQGVAYKTIVTFATARRHTGSERPVGSKSVDVLRKRAWVDPWTAGLPDHAIDDLFGSYRDPESDPATTTRVRRAVRSLPADQRRNVFHRFWMDDPGSRSDQDQWRNTIRPKLRTSLEKLSCAV